MRSFESMPMKEGMGFEILQIQGPEPGIGILHDHALDEVLGRCVDARRELKISGQDSLEDQILGAIVERWATAEDLKDRAAEGPDVGALVAALILNDLLGHELWGSHIILEDLMPGGIPRSFDLGILQVFGRAEID